MKPLRLAIPSILAVALLGSCGGGDGKGNIVPPLGSIAFSSTPPSSASEGLTYNYIVTTNSSGQAPVTYQLAEGPSTATLLGDALTWIPSSSESRVQNRFSVIATSGNATAHQDWTLTPSGNVNGTAIVTYHTESGDTQQPEDLGQSPITAAVPDGKGGFTILTGAGSPNGTFAINGVPTGSYWLQTGPQTFVWTDSSSIDVG